MPDARTRTIDLCRRGFAPVAISSSTQPGGGHPPHPVAQRELDVFLERSARRFEPIDTVLEALFADAVDVGVMRAALVYDNGVPEGLLHLDARDAAHTQLVLVKEPTGRQEECAIDVWGQAPVSIEARWRSLAPLAGADTEDVVLAPIVRHLQGRCSQLLRRLLYRVLAAQAVHGVFVLCRFTSPLEPGAATPARCCELWKYSYEDLRGVYTKTPPGARRRPGQVDLATALTVSRTTLLRHLKEHLHRDWKQLIAENG